MNTAELLKQVDRLKATMISVATGGARIENVQPEFADTFDAVSAELSSRGIDNALPYRDLWQWYGHWSGIPELKTYQSRRIYVATLFEPLIKTVQTGGVMAAPSSGNANRPQLLKTAIERLERCISKVEALDPATLEKWSPKVDAMQASVDDTLARTFGHDTVEYKRYHRDVNWAAQIPSFGGETTLGQFRQDVVKGKGEVLAMLAQAVESLQEQLARIIHDGGIFQRRM